jgi:cell division protein FtsB
MKRKFWHKVYSLLTNKYLITLLLFGVWIIFFDKHNLVDRYKSKEHLNQLKKDTVFYQSKIRSDREKMKLLKTNPQNLERFAREQYLMKSPDEDVFIILKKGQTK